MKRVTLTTQQKMYSLLTVVILFIVGVLLFFHRVNVDDTARIYNQFASSKKEIESLIESGSMASTIQKDLERIKATTIHELNQSLIREGEELLFLQSIEKFSATYGLIQTIQLQEKDEEDAGFPFPISRVFLDVSGDFKSILQYVDSLEKSEYYIQILSITMNKGTATTFGNTNTGTLQGNLPGATPILIEETIPNSTGPIINAKINAVVFWEI